MANESFVPIGHLRRKVNSAGVAIGHVDQNGTEVDLGGATMFTELTDAATVNLRTVNPVLDADFNAKADYRSVRDESTTSWILNAENHANRPVHAVNAGAITVTWNTGHGMTRGDCGTIFQTGAGAVTISAGTGTLTLSPGAVSAVTSAQWGQLDWEYMGSDRLLVTRRT